MPAGSSSQQQSCRNVPAEGLGHGHGSNLQRSRLGDSRRLGAPPPPTPPLPSVDLVVGVGCQCQAPIFKMIQMPLDYSPLLAIKINKLAETHCLIAVKSTLPHIPRKNTTIVPRGGKSNSCLGKLRLVGNSKPTRVQLCGLPLDSLTSILAILFPLPRSMCHAPACIKLTGYSAVA